MKTEMLQSMEEEFMSHLNALLSQANKSTKKESQDSTLRSSANSFLSKKKESLDSNVEDGKSKASQNKITFSSVKSIISIPRLNKFKLKDDGE